MPLYGWAGPGNMRELTLDRAQPPTFTVPTGPDAAPSSSVKLFICQECQRKFKKAMIAARHFNYAHEALKLDSDSWRTHVQEVWE